MVRYSEYQRKPRKPFRKAVARAAAQVRGRGQVRTPAKLKSGAGATSATAAAPVAMKRTYDESEGGVEVAGHVSSGGGELPPTPHQADVERVKRRRQEGGGGDARPGASHYAFHKSRSTGDLSAAGKRLTPNQRGNVRDAVVGEINGRKAGEIDMKDAHMELPPVGFDDIGGVDKLLWEIIEIIGFPLVKPGIFTHLGTEPPSGILLHGPPGCGKTLLANVLAGELKVHFHKVAGPELVSSMSGDSESQIRELFDRAKATAPSLIFIDEIDAIAPKREDSNRGMEKRIVAQLLTCLDSLSVAATKNKPVVVIGATSRPGSIDPGLRRAGRFDREIALPIPDEDARKDILSVLCRNLRIADKLDYRALARATPGFVGADLSALTKEASVLALKRAFDMVVGDLVVGDDARPDSGAGDVAVEEPKHGNIRAMLQRLREPQSVDQGKLEKMSLSAADFDEAVKRVQPSATREGFGTVPGITWDDVGALSEAREALDMAIVQPITRPELFKKLGVTVQGGVLLYGPPGCGKTLLAKAIANASSANFISVKGPELLDKYVGESEKAVRNVFEKARACSPCIVFFDELDALAPKRGATGSSGVSERVVNQLLTELDGLDKRKEVFVLGATNRPDMIDDAMKRPGRFGTQLYVPLPTAEGRVQILRTLTRKTPLDDDVDLEVIGKMKELERFSGADLAGLVKEAATNTLRAVLASGGDGESMTVTTAHFKEAARKVRPSVARKDQARYHAMRSKIMVRQPLGKPASSSEEPRDGASNSEGMDAGAAPRAGGAGEVAS